MTQGGPEATEQDISDAIEALFGIYRRRAATIAAIEDPQHAFDKATELLNEVTSAMRGLAKAAGELRAQAAMRILDAESLSLGELANRIGVSGSRAGQIVKPVRDARKEQV